MLAGLAAGAASPRLSRRAAEALLPGPPPGPKSAPSRPVVAVARRPGLVTASGAIDPKLLEAALGAAVARAAGEATPVAAMRRLFKPTDVVGIKVNCLGGRGVSTRPEVALQLAAFLQAAGVPADRIYVWDRTDRELRAAGYVLDRGRGVRVFGTNEDFDGRLVEWGPSASRFDRVLATELTALISCSVLKDHGLAGASLTMKNWYGVVHNPNKLHDDNCAPFVPHLVACPVDSRQAPPQRRGRRARAVPRRAGPRPALGLAVRRLPRLHRPGGGGRGRPAGARGPAEGGRPSAARRRGPRAGAHRRGGEAGSRRRRPRPHRAGGGVR